MKDLSLVLVSMFDLFSIISNTSLFNLTVNFSANFAGKAFIPLLRVMVVKRLNLEMAIGSALDVSSED